MSKERQLPCPTCRTTLSIPAAQASVTCSGCGASFRLKKARFRATPELPPEPPPIVVQRAPHGLAPYVPPPQPVVQKFQPLTPPTGPVPDPRKTMPVTIDEPVVNGIWLCIGFLLAPLIIAGIVAAIVITVSAIGGAFISTFDIIRNQ